MNLGRRKGGANYRYTTMQIKVTRPICRAIDAEIAAHRRRGHAIPPRLADISTQTDSSRKGSFFAGGQWRWAGLP